MATDKDKDKGVTLDTLLSTAKVSDDNKALTEQALGAVLNEIVAQGASADRVSTQLIDKMLADIDTKLSGQMDQVIHHPDFQKLESTWRGLDYLLANTNFHENIRINILSATKDEIHDDLINAPSIYESGLYKHVYTNEYGQFGGTPYGAIIGDFEYGYANRDVDALTKIAAVSNMAFAPFISAAAPSLFDIDNWKELPGLKDLAAITEMPQYAKWNSFRQNEDSRNVALVLPHFLLRVPYGDEEPISTFNYTESAVEDHEYLWGNAAYTFGSRLTDSFANYRWCANIIGPKGGGTVDNLPLHTYEQMGQIATKIPTNILISERREFELAEQGLIALTMRKNGGDAVYFSANSTQKAKQFPDTPAGQAAETNYKLGTQLPYMFIATRLAHYIKVLQRENIGRWLEREDVEREVNAWLEQYIIDMASPDDITRSKKPLRSGRVNVEDIPGDPGWYKTTMEISPHFKFMGGYFTLSLVGKLEKAA